MLHPAEAPNHVVDRAYVTARGKPKLFWVVEYTLEKRKFTARMPKKWMNEDGQGHAGSAIGIDRKWHIFRQLRANGTETACGHIEQMRSKPDESVAFNQAEAECCARCFVLS